MTRIDRYIIRKFFGTFFFILLILLTILLVIDVVEKIDAFIEKKPPQQAILNYYKDFILFYGNLISPICIFIAVIFFTSKLTQNTEIVALLSGGVSFYRILATYLFCAFILAAASFYLNAFTVPTANANRVAFEDNYINNKHLTQIHVHKKSTLGSQKTTEGFVYLYNFVRNRDKSPDGSVKVRYIGYNISLERYEGNRLKEILYANTARWMEAQQKWRLSGQLRRYVFQDTCQYLQHLDSLDTAFNITPGHIFIKDMHAESLPLNKLTEAIEREKELESSLVAELERERYERYAYPFAALILTVIGFAVSTRKRRGGIALQLGIGLLLSLSYVLLVLTGNVLFGDTFPAWFTVWIPNLVFGLAGFFLIRIAPK